MFLLYLDLNANNINNQSSYIKSSDLFVFLSSHLISSIIYLLLGSFFFIHLIQELEIFISSRGIEIWFSKCYSKLAVALA